MKSLAQAISEAWGLADTALPAGTHIVDQPDEAKALEARARELDDILSKRLQPVLEQWSQGLISALELHDKVLYEGMRIDY
jgi:hypothetical protein